MSREEQVEKLTAYMANFIGYTAKVLPDDVIAKLDELPHVSATAPWPWAPGDGRKIFRYGRSYRKYGAPSLHHWRGSQCGLLVPQKRPYHF